MQTIEIREVTRREREKERGDEWSNLPRGDKEKPIRRMNM